MAAYVLAQADVVPDKIALSILTPGQAEHWTFARLKSAVLGTAAGLLQAGGRPGDRLLMRLDNTLDFPITYLAAVAVGILPVPTSPQLGETEVAQIADQLNASLAVVAPDVVCPPLPGCTVLSIEELRPMHRMRPADFVLGDPDRAAYIIFTSGTAAAPRGVVHAHRAVWARRMMWQDWVDLRAEDRLLHAGAFNWTYTLGTGLMDPWAAGATALIPGADCTSAMLPALMAQHEATIFAAAPGIYRQLLRAKTPALPRLRHALSAGEKLPETTRTNWRRATGTEIYEAFGMSECSTFISASPGRPAPPGTLGFAQPGRQVAILSGDGLAEPDQPGVIAIARSDPGLMLGYLGADAGADDPASKWFLTGDIGKMAASGAITYLGRTDDMLNAGGYRVSPMEVETAMGTHADIGECAAVETTVADGVRVIALFYTSPAPMTDETLAGHAASQLARYKQPRIFHRLAQLPRSANGKIMRRALRIVKAGNPDETRNR